MLGLGLSIYSDYIQQGFENKKSVNFDGVDGVLVTPVNSLNVATYSFWAKSRKTTANRVFGHGSDSRTAFAFNWGGGSKSLLFLGNNWYTFWANTPQQDDNKWNHWAIVMHKSDPSSCRLFVNGSEVSHAGLGLTGGELGDTEGMTVGSTSEGGSPFEGNLDEFAIFNTLLDEAEIIKIYNGGVPFNLLNNNEAYQSKDNLTTYYRMGDSDTFPTIKDNSVNSNDANMVNMVAGDIVTDAP